MSQVEINWTWPWVTKTEYYEEDTGEELKEKQVKKHYLKINKTVRSYGDKERKTNVKHISWGCIKSRQLEIFG